MDNTQTKREVSHKQHRLHYDVGFKWQVCHDYLYGFETKAAVQKRYGIPSNSAIKSWLEEFGLKDSVKSLTLKEQLSLMMAQTELQKIQTEQSEIERLKKELADANLRATAYQMMIEIAEKELKIDILKKYVAKQSTLSKKSNQP